MFFDHLKSVPGTELKTLQNSWKIIAYTYTLTIFLKFAAPLKTLHQWNIALQTLCSTYVCTTHYVFCYQPSIKMFQPSLFLNVCRVKAGVTLIYTFCSCVWKVMNTFAQLNRFLTEETQSWNTLHRRLWSRLSHKPWSLDRTRHYSKLVPPLFVYNWRFLMTDKK